MKVNLKLFLPTLPEVIGSKELEVEFAGTTVNELVDHLIASYGNNAKQALLDEQGNLDPMIQVLLNGEKWITSDQLDMPLENGDDLVLLMMMAGGF
jgi:molybdopterin synthase sulfur carrier subunit